MKNRNPAAIISGVVILWDALVARLALTADASRVYCFGHPISWECSLRRVGLPCPTCGITRSIVMALHGEFGAAWHMAPGGPVLLAGVLLAAVVLLIGAARQTTLPRWIKPAGALYATAALAIWLIGWAGQFHAALAGR
jgi:Protein of unknown function (DUF2752)